VAIVVSYFQRSRKPLIGCLPAAGRRIALRELPSMPRRRADHVPNVVVARSGHPAECELEYAPPGTQPAVAVPELSTRTSR